ncbi:MAG TPA: hypothetical protein DCE42_25910 [Myxococcales bacterium]|nr:hypothetical protein [Deltaproteobacteria bacterium]HAA58226.1 hypothetical protein [Myxococcales bacterium]
MHTSYFIVSGLRLLCQDGTKTHFKRPHHNNTRSLKTLAQISTIVETQPLQTLRREDTIMFLLMNKNIDVLVYPLH